MNESYEREFQSELAGDETILWAGRPERRIVFVKSDGFIVPISFMWFVGTWLRIYCTARTDYSEQFGRALEAFDIVVFGGIAFYLLIGRFVYMYLVKRSTYYAVTNRRVISMCTMGGKKVHDMEISAIPGVHKSVGKSGMGVLLFGDYFAVVMNNRTGMVPCEKLTGGRPCVAFYDVRDCEAVFELVSGLRDKSVGKT